MNRVVSTLSLLALTVLIVAGCSLLRMSPDVDFEASTVEGRAPLPVQFTPQTDGTPVSYAWDFGDGYTSNQPNPVHVYTSHGTYSVMLTVGFAEGDSVTRIKKRLLTVDPQLPQAPIVDPYSVYWISETTSRIRRGTYDGSMTEDVASNAATPSGFDIAGGRIYWVTTTWTGGILESSELDGSDRKTLVREENRLGDVAVDAKRGKIYWTSLPESPLSLVDPGEGSEDRTWDGGIRRANLDGSNVETLVEYPSGSAAYADRIVVAPYAGLVLWSAVGDGYEGAIGRASVVPAPGFWRYANWLDTGVGRPKNMTVDTIPGFGASSLYYTTGDEVRRIGLFPDLYSSKHTVLTGLDEPSGIAVDPSGYYIFIGTPDGILRCLRMTDGSNLEMRIPDAGGVGTIVINRPL